MGSRAIDRVWWQQTASLLTLLLQQLALGLAYLVRDNPRGNCWHLLLEKKRRCRSEWLSFWRCVDDRKTDEYQDSPEAACWVETPAGHIFGGRSRAPTRDGVLAGKDGGRAYTWILLLLSPLKSRDGDALNHCTLWRTEVLCPVSKEWFKEVPRILKSRLPSHVYFVYLWLN